jgi:MFS family permease
MTAPAPAELDPKRWFAASVAIVSVAIPVLDNTILNLAVPTILREFDTQLSSLQWVITGYSLTFATLLIIGGRLGDIYGHRRRPRPRPRPAPAGPPAAPGRSSRGLR